MQLKFRRMKMEILIIAKFEETLFLCYLRFRSLRFAKPPLLKSTFQRPPPPALGLGVPGRIAEHFRESDK